LIFSAIITQYRESSRPPSQSVHANAWQAPPIISAGSSCSCCLTVGGAARRCYAASHRAVDKLKTSGILPSRVQVRSCKYLNKRTAWRLQRHAVAALEKEIAQGFAVRATPSFSGQTLKRIQAGILDSEFTPPKIQREFKAAKAQFRI
jgi:hypothetical protein